MLGRCGPALGPVLQGVQNPLQLLFPGGSFDTAEKLYTESAGPHVFNSIAARAIAEEVRSRPNGTIRVLEIGGGTGATTASIAQTLPPERSEYVFTDVSPLFIARAAKKFRDYPFLKYQTLDIERDPETQGFRAGHFDLIVAANVLHATVDLSVTMDHVRKLLAPSGLLVLIEAIVPEGWVDLTFGLTDGWWRFRDTTLRPDYPLISGDAWKRGLLASGFEEAGVVQPATDSPGAVFLARNPDPAKSDFGRFLIIQDSLGVAADLTSCVESSGGSAKLLPSEHSLANELQKEDFGYVVCVAATSGISSPEHVAQDVFGDVTATTARILHVVQAMAAGPTKARLFVVTSGAQPVLQEEPELNITQAPVWGLAKTIALEHADLWGGIIDVDFASGRKRGRSGYSSEHPRFGRRRPACHPCRAKLCAPACAASGNGGSSFAAFP